MSDYGDTIYPRNAKTERRKEKENTEDNAT